MKSQLDRMREKTEKHLSQVMEIGQQNYKTIDNHLGQVQAEYHRVVELSGQAARIINEIDEAFKKKTKLSDTDIVLLFLCTAIQCTRQYLLPNDKFRISDKQGDALKKKVLKPLPRDWQDVLTQSVPYDALKTGPDISGTGLGGGTHRYRTLGHDPVLGWVFGTANIMTSSLSKTDFETYCVENNLISSFYPFGIGGMMNDAVEYSQVDKMLLPVSVARQAIHYGSDYFTKQGLPVPIIATVNNDMSQFLTTKAHIDMWSITRSAGLSVMINSLIYCIHRLFYNPEKDGSESMYEVRSRKILSYSNAMASGSNAIVVAMGGNLNKLDVGGMLVTIHRIVSDYKFINEVKRDFLKNEFYNMVVGDEYDFMEE